jgi:AcrR family transcriptional regulator
MARYEAPATAKFLQAWEAEGLPTMHETAGDELDRVARLEPFVGKVEVIANPDLSPRKRPVQERSRHLVEAIVEATRRLLISDGYKTLTMARIAKVAGVSPGSLYQYFPSVDSLLVVLYEQVRVQELQSFEALQEALRPLPLEQAIERLLLGLSSLLNAGLPLASELAKWVPVLDPAEEKIAPIDQRVTDLVSGFLRVRADETRELDPDLAGMMVARSLLSVVRYALAEQPTLITEPRFFAELVQLVHGFVRRV